MLMDIGIEVERNLGSSGGTTTSGGGESRGRWCVLRGGNAMGRHIFEGQWQDGGGAHSRLSAGALAMLVVGCIHSSLGNARLYSVQSCSELKLLRIRTDTSCYLYFRLVSSNSVVCNDHRRQISIK